MKSDGADQMNTVAKTAQYPFERLAVRCDAASVRAGDVLFISKLVQDIFSSRIVRVPQASDPSDVCNALGPLKTRDTTASLMHASKIWDGYLHKFSRV